MKVKIFSFLFLFIYASLFSQQGEWEWLKGNNGINTIGNYGAQGVPALANNPGARESSIRWTDASGNFWLFGGLGYAGVSGRLNDLWKYDPNTNEWTWMKGSNTVDQNGVYGTQGVSSPTNYPGSRSHAIKWVDGNGNLWLFGGVGYGSSGGVGYLTDLWKYNIATNVWTWMKGSNTINQNGTYGTLGISSPTNNPGSRWAGTGWYDNSGFLWLLGGSGYPATGTNGLLNDLWKFNTSTNEWTWVGGSNLIDQLGLYGTQGVPSSTNCPGARYLSSSWKDFSGNFWLFAGGGFPAVGSAALLNDLWRYNPITNQWTWMKGSNLTLQNGNYGTIGVPVITNNPGSRYESEIWIDPSSNVWMFGGFGLPASGITAGGMNDQWTYNMSTNMWTWVKGSQLLDQFGTYGTQGIPAPANIPGSRKDFSGWVDYCGNLYLFGGLGKPGAGPSGYLNDLWKFNNVAAPPTPTNVTPVQNQTICSNNSATLMALPIMSGTINWYSTPVSTLVLGTGTAFITPSLSTGTYTYYAEAYTCTNSINRTAITLSVLANPTIAVNSGSICVGQSFTMNPSGAASYTYSSGSAVVSPTLTSLFTVVGTSSNGCVSPIAAVSTVTVFNLPTVTVNSGSICSGYNFTIVPSGAQTYSYSGGSAIVSPSSTTNYSVIGTSSNGCVSSSSAVSTVSVILSPSMSVNSGSICYGQSFTMNPSGAPSYTFSNGFAVVNPTISTTYSVTGTGTNGCVSPVPGISTVTVIQPPVIVANSASICLGNSFTITPTGAQTYTFSSGTAIVSPTTTTSYSVTGTSSLGCTNFTPTVFNLTVNPVPSVSVTTTSTFLCVGQSATLSGSGGLTYNWTGGSTDATLAVSPTVTSSYTVTGYNSFGCSNSAAISISVDICAGVSISQNGGTSFHFYPNPSNGLIYLETELNATTQLYILDVVGRIIKEIELTKDMKQMDLTELKKGIYFIQTKANGKLIYNGKLLLE